MTAGLISVDWGTTSLRCSLINRSGAILEHVKSERGILKTEGVAFGDILRRATAPWLGRFEDATPVPVLMSGMIGSRQGWQEAAYLRCPASPHDLAQNLSCIDTAGSPLARCDIRIVPGMDVAGAPGDGILPDVMRGEETQVLGALLASGAGDALFVLPGTHSKWVAVRDQSIVAFRTFMTGEIYAALLSSTILGRLATDADGESDADAAADAEGFGLGVATAAAAHRGGSQSAPGGPGDLLHLVFSARSRVLLGELPETAVRGYLSGLLIGAEVLSGAALGQAVFGDAAGTLPVQALADPSLRRRYLAAAAQLGVHCVVPGTENPVAAAHLAIARFAGIVP